MTPVCGESLPPDSLCGVTYIQAPVNEIIENEDGQGLRSLSIVVSLELLHFELICSLSCK